MTLVANSAALRGDGERGVEGGEAGAAGRRLGSPRPPFAEPDEIDGDRGHDVLQVRLGEAEVAGMTQAAAADGLLVGGLDPGPGRVARPELRRRLSLPGAYAQLGEGREAAAEAAEVLREQPGFSAEAWVNNDFFQPGGSSAALSFDGARKAGLPICATAEVAAKFEPGNRLPECEAERAKVAAPKR